MSLEMFRPVLGRYYFVSFVEKAVKNKSDLTMVFLHRQHREELRLGSVFLDYEHRTHTIKLVIALYVTGTIIHNNAHFLSWVGSVYLFQKGISESKEIYGHNAARTFLWERTDIGEHRNLEEALDKVGFRYTEDIFKPKVVHKPNNISPKPKYLPKNDPKQERFF